MSSILHVRLSAESGLFVVRCADTGLHLAGLLSAENRALYLSFWPGWEVVG